MKSEHDKGISQTSEKMKDYSIMVLDQWSNYMWSQMDLKSLQKSNKKTRKIYT